MTQHQHVRLPQGAAPPPVTFTNDYTHICTLCGRTGPASVLCAPVPTSKGA